MSHVHKISPNLWFDTQAEEAAEFYTGIFPNSQVNRIARYPEAEEGMAHKMPAGSIMTVDFELDGQSFVALNAGPVFKFNEAISFVVEVDDQVEVDRVWHALTADGGEPGPCGWLKDRFGLSWQIAPRELNELLDDPDPDRARRAMEAMLKMGKIEVEGLRRAADAA